MSTERGRGDCSAAVGERRPLGVVVAVLVWAAVVYGCYLTGYLR
jgi:hypothetical protein